MCPFSSLVRVLACRCDSITKELVECTAQRDAATSAHVLLSSEKEGMRAQTQSLQTDLAEAKERLESLQSSVQGQAVAQLSDRLLRMEEEMTECGKKALEAARAQAAAEAAAEEVGSSDGNWLSIS